MIPTRAETFRKKLSDNTISLPDHVVLADSAFPVSNDLFVGRIITPLKSGDLRRAHQGARRALTELNKRSLVFDRLRNGAWERLKSHLKESVHMLTIQ